MTQPGDVRVRAGAALGVRQDRRSSTSPAGWPSSASSSSPPAAPRRRCARRASRSARSRTSRASRRSWAAASRRCTRSSTPACSRCATTRSTWRRRSEHEIEFVDLVCVNLYPFEAHGGPPRRDRARGDREHRHRRPDDDPRGGEELRLLGGGGQARELRRRAAGAARDARAGSRWPTRESLAAEAFAYTARYDTAIARWFAEQAGASSRRWSWRPTRRSPTSPTARTRTSAPPTTRRPARACTCSRMVRQLGGKELSFNNVLDLNAGRLLVRRVRGPGLRDHQAQQPVRGGGRRRRRSRPTERAFACDPLSAFGGVICVNRPVDGGVRRRRCSSSSAR